MSLPELNIHDVYTYHSDSVDLMDKVLLPFDINPQGCDIRYSDNYILIKTEIDKLTKVNFEVIKDTAEIILLTESKDLRVCGYYVLALTYLQGINGLIFGLDLYTKFISKYYDICFPEKTESKISTILWLNSNKLVSFVNSYSTETNSIVVGNLNCVINELNNIINYKSDISYPVLTVFTEYISSNINSFESNDAALVSEKKTKSSNDLNNITNSNDRVKNQKISDKKSIYKIDTRDDILRNVKNICNYLNSKGDYIQSIKFSRACMWSSCQVPSHTSFITQVSAPSQTTINEIDAKYNNREFDDVIRLSERLFFQEGGNYMISLQKFIYDSSISLEKFELAKEVLLQVKEFVNRLGDDLLELKFSNKFSFADEPTKQWLKYNLLQDSVSNEVDADLENEIIHAKSIFFDSDLLSGIKILDNFICSTEKEKVKIEYEKAKMCMHAGELVISKLLLSDLYIKICEKLLFLWDSNLAIDVAVTYKNLLLVDDAGNDSDNMEEVNDISKNIIRWDLKKAIEFA